MTQQGRAARTWWQSGPLGADTLAVYGSLAGLIVVTAVLGTRGGGSLTRVLFIAGCMGVGWRALRAGAGAHVEAVMVLFIFAPFLRRLVDMSVGYDPGGIMLVGPILAMALPLWQLKVFLLQRSPGSQAAYTPYLIMLACLAYAWILAAFDGEAAAATSNAIKMFVPVLYAMYLIQRHDACDEVLHSATRALMFCSPIIGLYGVLQYVLLPNWDRLWMLNSVSLNSIGLPEPLKVRVFSTMNSPASFGAFLTSGLLFYGFCKRSWFSILMLFPISLGLLLSLYRTGWIELVLAVCFCFLFRTTRTRATVLTLSLIGAGTLALVATPFGPEIGSRLSSMLNPSNDGSSHERLREYMVLYSDMDHYLFGNGMARGFAVSAQMLAVDGQFIASPVLMGIFVGNIHLMALIWACLQGVFSLRQDSSPAWLVAGAVAVANVLLLPLGIISVGEVAFLTFTLIALLTAKKQRDQAVSLRTSRARGSRARAGWHNPALAHTAPARRTTPGDSTALGGESFLDRY